MTEQDRRVSSHLETRSNMQNPELSSGVFTDRKQAHGPQDRLFAISFPLTCTDYLFSKKEKIKVCPPQLFSLTPVLQSRLYRIPRGQCGRCSLTHVLCSPRHSPKSSPSQQWSHWLFPDNRLCMEVACVPPEAGVSETGAACVAPDAGVSETERRASLLTQACRRRDWPVSLLTQACHSTNFIP